MKQLQCFERTTGLDIFLEANGRRMAAVKSCEAAARREGLPLAPFGESEGRAAGLGPMQYTLTLTRLAPEAEEIDLFSLSGFSLVIVKPESRILYEGCEWLSITERLSPDTYAVENAVLLALSRRRLPKEE
ncbi:MAG TPA: hypothetical protein IAD07_04705 [Candidatus Fimivicinus intestinavium]|nr:hypothetical protein [Candidatus Fimivicinus intestinavium]